MIGVLDSGSGGLYTYRLLRELSPNLPLALFLDRKGAPYGTKQESEIISRVGDGIRSLIEIGADRVLIACCTASTVYNKLTDDLKDVSVPIISPAAHLAAKVGGRVAIIATSHTTASHAFRNEIHSIDPRVRVLERDAQPLVTMVDNGSHDGFCSKECREYLDLLAKELEKFRPDTLVLGCTHFSNLECELKARLDGVKIISPARVGAFLIASEYPPSRITQNMKAKNIYTEGRHTSSERSDKDLRR
jgi:glutamate racemase